MATHQKDENASVLWHYFQSVINWVKATFPRNERNSIVQPTPRGIMQKARYAQQDHLIIET